MSHDGKSRIARQADTVHEADRRLDALAAQMGANRHGGPLGTEFIKLGRRRPLVTVRCARRHQLGGVWNTPLGPVYASWPHVYAGTEAREGQYGVRPEDHKRRQSITRPIDSTYCADAGETVRVVCDCGWQVLGLTELFVTTTEALRSRPRELLLR